MEIRKICIIHLNQIGDLVFSLPLLKALRDSYPESTIHSVVRPYLTDLLSHSPYIDDLIYRRGGIKESLLLLGVLRRSRYDLLITLSNSWETLFLTTFSRARVKVGFEYFPWDFSLDIKEKVEGHRSLYNNLKLLEKLSIQVEKKDYVGLLKLPPRDDSGGGRRVGRYVVISPGTSTRRRIKAWGEEKFADVIIALKKRYDLNPVLVGGEDSKEVNDKIIEILNQNDVHNKIDCVENLAGKMDLKDLCYLLRDADLFVGVDSGIMHLASSFDIPVVGIFGPTDPAYAGPQGSRSTVAREEMECVPCYLKGCKEKVCMEKLEANKVLKACEQVLRQ
jgi:heptosyltransferase-2